jgi:hypothetical protein
MSSQIAAQLYTLRDQIKTLDSLKARSNGCARSASSMSRLRRRESIPTQISPLH